MNTLFDFEQLSDKKSEPKAFCRTCEHIQKWECGGSYFFYCGVRKSNRTQNGLLKVKCKNEACNAYKERVKK